MNDFIIYVNELKEKNIEKYKIIGISCFVILSTTLFKSNKDLKPFIPDCFLLNEQYKDYVYDSRTVLVSRICRVIYESDDSKLNSIRKNLHFFLVNKINNSNTNTNTPKKSSSGIKEWMGSKNNE